ncbi:hypothetical protein [Pseudonocardia sp. H11422]|uniref:hypothetical protein n=1 Tax=Pseudonocardia sp. H11422 TaxID=2835866 RepID=UPI001BDC42D2|nr:hypothetical protein [Pseudonocardia sp. H11422]
MGATRHTDGTTPRRARCSGHTMLPAPEEDLSVQSHRSSPTTVDPSATTELQVTLRGADVLVGVRGVLEGTAGRRLPAVLDVVVADGARHVIVDLSESPDVPAAVIGYLERLRRRLRGGDGWLLVEGASIGLEPALQEVFAAYRDAVAHAGHPRVPAQRRIPEAG